MLADKIDLDIQDTLYALIEPMDAIEIYMAGSAYKKAPSGPPIMMRGFVSSVQRMEGMSADGKPSRMIVVSGQDYGKIMQILQIFNMPFGQDVASTVTSFPFFARFGFESRPMTAEVFIGTVFDKVVNPYLATMRENPDGTTASTAPLLPIKTDIQSNGEQVSPFGVGGWSHGTMQGLITQFCDIGPWNEFFIEDREDAPYAVYRPNPFRDAATASLILPGAAAPAITDVTRADVVTMTCERSDATVGNYYWVGSPRFSIVHGSVALAVAFQSSAKGGPKTVYVDDYGNVNPALYGTRKMEEATQMAGPDEQYNGNGLNGSALEQSKLGQLDWITLRREQLIAQNRDNVVFETGSLHLKGNEAIRAGTYVRLNSGDMRHLYYVVSVTHDFAPFGNYFTTVAFERGTGFIDRTTRSAKMSSPYWAEIVRKSQ
ncbi:hypothetical protein [Cupriavidus sp. D39]|uniref:hypothetical protein n=1 Tax=Cupriavidus sp. D39 TaxID=2997877 RepID=UPI00226D7370|nr:hypothetical protein [Cupriavidus sp. D39]MCY0856877.1 hypothetical protein [Cupriavidus sp. D39]